MTSASTGIREAEPAAQAPKPDDWCAVNPSSMPSETLQAEQIVGRRKDDRGRSISDHDLGLVAALPVEPSSNGRVIYTPYRIIGDGDPPGSTSPFRTEAAIIAGAPVTRVGRRPVSRRTPDLAPLAPVPFRDRPIPATRCHHQPASFA